MLQNALVFGFWVNYGVERNISGEDPTQSRIPVAVQLIPARLLLCMVWMIESPRWLASKNRMEQAHKSLAWVRHLPMEHKYVANELAEIQAAVNHELEITGGELSYAQILRECGAPGVRNRIIIAVLLMLLQNFTGINAINYYSATIFKSIGFTGTSVQLLATGVYGLVKMATTLVFMVWIVDRFGRRPALLIGAVGAGIAMFYLAIYSQVSQSFEQLTRCRRPRGRGDDLHLRRLLRLLVERNPLDLRFMVVYSLPHMVESITFGTFYFFGACTVVALIFAYFLVPETKGIPLEDMDLLLGPGVSTYAQEARQSYERSRNARNAQARANKTVGDEYEHVEEA
ncbi:uncharacterized protein BJX67DRAFT_379611 [Aspergillus lucknowensis]|uniref:General substrate transporter n=1 Tax=Aspergillus lucknowensis TaxID=176173 RepID=A0ABR4LX76_9EURO